MSVEEVRAAVRAALMGNGEAQRLLTQFVEQDGQAGHVSLQIVASDADGAVHAAANMVLATARRGRRRGRCGRTCSPPPWRRHRARARLRPLSALPAAAGALPPARCGRAARRPWRWRSGRRSSHVRHSAGTWRSTCSAPVDELSRYDSGGAGSGAGRSAIHDALRASAPHLQPVRAGLLAALQGRQPEQQHQHQQHQHQPD